MKYQKWKRFWMPIGASFSLSDRGYLVDPESELGRRLIPKAASFQSISQQSCLLLLGEPGMGKSSALREQFDSSCHELDDATTDQFLWLDLHEVGSEYTLQHDLFDAPMFQEWLRGGHILHVFLDSFDECRLMVQTLVPRLLQHLRKAPIERLRLRIACRIADLPTELKQGLTDIWSESEVGVFELLPLRRQDVELGVDAEGIDSDTFFREIDRAGATSLAIKPLTLNFLLARFKSEGSLTSSAAELFQEGTRLLCEETQHRAEPGGKPRLSALQRRSIAERIAFLTIFGNCNSILVGTPDGSGSQDDLLLDQITGNDEVDAGISTVVTEAAVREALGTGLFSARGAERLGWAHQTYAEYLAARYITRHNVPLIQIVEILIHPNDPNGKVIPQLQETAVWLAGMREDMYDYLLSHEPELLIRSEAIPGRYDLRSALVDTLLDLYNRDAIFGVLRDRLYYHHLLHPGLAQQLHSYITGRHYGARARHVAMDIAEACQLRELTEELLSVALDAGESVETRVQAAFAIMQLGTAEDKARLKPLVLTSEDADPDAELRGCGLLATWPDSLSADELMAAIPQNRSGLVGALSLFIGRDPIDKLAPPDLPVALDWATRHIGQDELSYDNQRLVNATMLRGWACLEEPGVLPKFAGAVHARLRAFEQVFEGRSEADSRAILSQDDEKRRKLARSVLTLEPDDRMRLQVIRTSLVRREDFAWICATLSHMAEEERRRWAELLPYLVDYQDAGQLDALLTHRHHDSIVRDAVASFFQQVEINSEQADSLRRSHEQESRWQREQRASQARTEERQQFLLERLHTLVSQGQDGDLDAWWHLNYTLAIEPESNLLHEYESDLTALAGWGLLAEDDRVHIAELADRYLREQVPSNLEWIGNDIIHRPDWAAYRALRYLGQHDRQRFDQLPQRIWTKWAAVIAAYPAFNEESETQSPLICLAYSHDRQQILETVSRLIDREAEQGGLHIDGILRRVTPCWDDTMAKFLAKKAADSRYSAQARATIIEALLEHHDAEGQRLAEGFLATPLSDRPDDRHIAERMAVTLLTRSPQGGWEVVWPAVQADAEFAKHLFASLAWHHQSVSQLAIRLTRSQIAELFCRVAELYPHSEDVHPPGVHSIGERESIQIWRDELVSQLGAMGTREACDAITWLIERFPDLSWLKWTLGEAQAVTREKTWSPPSAEELTSLIQSRAQRVVQSEGQLMEVVLEALGQVEHQLQQAEPPASPSLWNDLGRGLFSPKDENSFSDYICNWLQWHLADRGIVANREVVVRKGDREDIRVQVSRLDGAEGASYPITVVIETKGCWNPELHRAMQEQLADRYLAEAQSRHGIYLIGWFQCDRWTKNENRKKNCPAYGLDDARQRFDRQAHELSTDGKVLRAFVMNTALR